ncbi:MAG: exodeoxyribonuclease VII large subunit [Firmicutes bacterium]|nr:exodeoxyribonuclease VII large subunit [Bacillota bacterium]
MKTQLRLTNFQMLNPITVTQFNRYISSVINAEELLKNIAVLGEISGASIKDNNLYFTLKDEGAQLPSICFGCGSLKIKNGDKVKVIGSPDFYQKGGKLSFIQERLSQSARVNFTNSLKR